MKKEETFLEKFTREHLMHLREKSIYELVVSFNREVGCMGWTGTRGAYLCALHTAFEESGFELDPTVFKPNVGLSLRRKVQVVGNKVVAITPESEPQ